MFSEKLKEELRLLCRSYLLAGSLEGLSKVKELLQLDEIGFGEFLSPLLKDIVATEEPTETDTDDSFSKEEEEVPTPTDFIFPYDKYLKGLEITGDGFLLGVVSIRKAGFDVFDRYGHTLTSGSYKTMKKLNLHHGDIISFTKMGTYLKDLKQEGTSDLPKIGELVTNCIVLKDDNGLYVTKSSDGRSLRDFGSSVSPFDVLPEIAERYSIEEGDLVDLFIEDNSIPFIQGVTKGNELNLPSKNELVSYKKTKRSKWKYHSTLDFDLEGKVVTIVGVEGVDVNKLRSVVLAEKGANELNLIEGGISKSKIPTEGEIRAIEHSNVVVIVRRFTCHTVSNYVSDACSRGGVALASTTSHGMSAIERAIYRALNGLSSDEGVSIEVDYPVLNK